ncbi:putative E3 ubiquitin-protein ligase XBAT31 [Platanthera zijinensis]|uniref:E3 ubiquitin-protein ligase XBAT31 n=1 Tax=Platanthera zijinensis TaxID=2320716 RepID=A0AAP0FXJ1_9ASPA
MIRIFLLLEQLQLKAVTRICKSLASAAHAAMFLNERAPLQGSGVELCCICFEQVRTIGVQDCGHQMCAHCILDL